MAAGSSWMPSAPAEPQEAERLAVLKRLEILDTPPEPAYDDIAKLAQTVFRSPAGAVNFVADTRHWTKALAGGDPGSSLAAELSFCAATVRTEGGCLILPDTVADVRWRSHPFVEQGSVGFYAGASIVVQGQPVGVVCVTGPEPREIVDIEVRALVALAGQAAAQLELGQRNAELQRLAVSDPLTGVANRTLLLDRLEAALDDPLGGVGVLFCDIDNFKVINDRLGHQAGDLLLREVAKRLSTTARACDTVGRIGGDEFVVICPELNSPDDLDAIARRVRDSDLGAPFATEGLPPLRLSVGAVRAEPGETGAAVLQRADMAMFAFKAAGPS
ncbi:MAG: sensor domain-containing diguanylate cyclase [Thermoleophilaceae bacterium]